MTLDWGREYLLCPPDHFEVRYAINPWMDLGTHVDRDRAREQWNALVATLRGAGATVHVLPAQPGLPDMVFTANAGIVDGRRYVAARMRHRERIGEIAHVEQWFERAGYEVVELSADVTQEGAGDALPMAGALIAGYRARSSVGAIVDLARAVAAPIVPVELANDRWYHIDLTLCPLDERRAIVFPEAWDAEGARRVRELIREPLVLDAHEAAQFAANSVVVGDTVVMPACPPRVGRQLEAWGFQVAVVDVSEFRKAGGAVRCLTLATDVALSPPAWQNAETAVAPLPATATAA